MRCQRCKGEGKIEFHDEHDEALGTKVTCPLCDGSGVHPENHCSICSKKMDMDAEVPDPAANCGGDCWECIEPFELEAPSRQNVVQVLKPSKRVTPDGTEW